MATQSLRQEAALRDAWLQQRLDEVVPRIMERAGIDAWVLVAREYNEDPVVATMLPQTWLSARRRTILVFTDRGSSRAAVTRYPVGDLFPGIWDPEARPDQWAALAEHLERADPASIAVDLSSTFALADGLSATEHQALAAALPDRLRSRLVGGESLAIGWLETRTAAEAEAYREACAAAHRFLGEALSGEAVEPGVTTTADLEWWLRERVREAGLSVWFHPAATVQRPGSPPRGSFSAQPAPEVILPGDLVHIDFGIVYLGLHTDQQQHAYVLGPGEQEAPGGLRAALAAGNTVQDLLLAEFRVGRTGNEVLAAARAAADAAALRCRIYSHPIGYHGHGAGPSIGLWDAQDGVPGAGDYPVYPDTAYSIELGVDVDVEEWDGATVSIMLEEDAFFDGERITWMDGRQTALHVIG
jgi:Xaa-Pro aminopeptidase